MNHTSCQFRDKHTVGGIVFYKHAFLVFFFSESVLSFNAGVSLNRSLNNTLKRTAVFSKLIILCLIAQYLFYFIPYITEVTEFLILFQYLLITHWFQSLFYHPMSLSNSLCLTHCSVLASRICFSGFSYLSLCVRKPTICLCENKDADQLCGNREAHSR